MLWSTSENVPESKICDPIESGVGLTCAMHPYSRSDRGRMLAVIMGIRILGH